MKTMNGLLLSIVVGIIGEAPLSQEKSKTLFLILEALCEAWKQIKQTPETPSIEEIIDTLRDLAREYQNEGKAMNAWRVERIADKLELLLRTYDETGLEELQNYIENSIEFIRKTEKLLNILASGEDIETKESKAESVIGKIKECLITLSEQVESGTFSMELFPSEVRYEKETLLVRIDGRTIIADNGGARVLPYAAYAVRDNKNRVTAIRFSGSIYAIATLMSILYRNVGELTNLVNEGIVFRNSKIVSPTYPGIHCGAIIEGGGQLKVRKSKRFITWLMLGLATLGDNRNKVVELLKGMARFIGSKNTEGIREGLKGLRKIVSSTNQGEKQEGGEPVWFIRSLLETIMRRIEALIEERNGKTVLENLDEQQRKTIADNLRKIAEKIENIIEIKKEIAEKLVAPIGEANNEERLAATLKLILEDIGLAPEIWREITQKEEQRKGRWLERIAEKWGTTKEKLAKAIARIAVATGILWATTKLAEITGTKSIAMAMALWLTFGPMAPIITRIFSRIGRKLGKHTENLISNIINGMIVAIMTILGMLAMNMMLVATAPKEKIEIDGETIEVRNPWRSPLRKIVDYEAPSIVWIVAATVIAIVASGVIGKMFSPEKIKKTLEGKEEINEPNMEAKDIIMKVGLIAAMTMGLTTYMKTWGIGITGPMPSGVLLSAIAWTWDEVDDLGDGAERIESWKKNKNNNEDDDGKKGKDEGIAEIVVLPFVLGAFAALCGITDPMQVVIPGSSGFLDYVMNNAIPEPWGTIIGAIIRIIFFVVGMLIACGTGGLGAVMYVVGSAMGQIIMMRFLSVVSMIE